MPASNKPVDRPTRHAVAFSAADIGDEVEWTGPFGVHMAGMIVSEDGDSWIVRHGFGGPLLVLPKDSGCVLSCVREEV